MRHRAHLAALIAAIAVAGCAAIDSRWDECEKGASSFVQMADCTTRTVQADAARSSNPLQRTRSEARAQRFAQITEDLSERVGAGRLADADARLVLRRVLDELLDAERDDRLSPIRQAPRTMTCSPSGGSVSCTQN